MFDVFCRLSSLSWLIRTTFRCHCSVRTWERFVFVPLTFHFEGSMINLISYILVQYINIFYVFIKNCFVCGGSGTMDSKSVGL